MPRQTPASEAEQLALRIASGVQDGSNFVEEFSEEFPDLGPAFKLLEVINDKVSFFIFSFELDSRR